MYFKKINEKEINSFIRSISTNNIFYISKPNHFPEKKQSKLAICSYKKKYPKKIKKNLVHNKNFVYIPKNKINTKNYNSENIYHHKCVSSAGFNVMNRKKIYNRKNNEINKNMNNSAKGKYIIETTKIEVFSPPQYLSNTLNYFDHNNIIYSDEELKNLKINIWKEENCCSSTESLCCLGTDIKNNNINIYDYL